ncbi:hypothetical protein SUGI_0899840 [Cryptomeria japonica]|nr:hypothetical protein SUGI_0899840 [Cryptomeria japonica]
MADLQIVHDSMKEDEKSSSGYSHGGSVLVQIIQAQKELKAIDECLETLRKNHEESKNRVKEGSITDRAKAMISMILEKVRSIQNLLDDLNRDQTGTVRMVVNGIRKSLKDRLDLLNHLRQNIRDDYREEVERYCFIVSGQYPSAQVVDEMMQSAEGHSFQIVHQALGISHGEDALIRVRSMEDKYKEIKGIEADLKELQQIFMDLSVLVWDQGEGLDEIEKNMVFSATAMEDGVAHLSSAATANVSSHKWIWIGVCCLLLVLLLVLVILVVLYFTQKSMMYAIFDCFSVMKQFSM